MSLFGLLALNPALSVFLSICLSLTPLGLAHYFFSYSSRKTLIIPNGVDRTFWGPTSTLSFFEKTFPLGFTRILGYLRKSQRDLYDLKNTKISSKYITKYVNRISWYKIDMFYISCVMSLLFVEV